MRIVCPNCAATYEVPDAAIPVDGQNVQCAACDTAWFFDPDNRDAEPVEPSTAAAPESAVTPEPGVRKVPVSEEPVQPRRPVAKSAAAQSATEPSRRPLDPQVADVLRKEKAFEARARAEEAGIEIQDDLPLEQPPQRPQPEPDEAAVAVVTGSKISRKDLLPDIDEINSTLRATSERKSSALVQSDGGAVLRQRRRGFRVGFGVMCFILAMATVLYSYADDVIAQAPGLEPSVDAYVDLINDGRLWLEAAVERLAEQIEA